MRLFSDLSSLVLPGLVLPIGLFISGFGSPSAMAAKQPVPVPLTLPGAQAPQERTPEQNAGMLTGTPTGIFTNAPIASAPEPPEFKPGTLGICGIYNWSGYLAVAADGRIVTLRQYCQQQRNWVWYEEGRFWERFRDVATVETLAFTQTLDRNQVEAYALSICPFLAEGRTVQDLSQMQADQQLPDAFERAVTIAAVRTYCRRYRDQLPDDD